MSLIIENSNLDSLKNFRVNHTDENRKSFGICFDVDGVLARGTKPVEAAIQGFKNLVNEDGQFKIPVAFVTNALNKNSDKAKQISNWLNVQVNPDQMIQAQAPLSVFTSLHDMHCLIIGQGKILEIAKALGFKRTCTLQDVKDAYPLLDVVDHDNRIKISEKEILPKTLSKIEAIILLGEPKRWESALQLLVDILRTDGRPDQHPHSSPERHLPVIACNMDLQFMHQSHMPRYGHGAFLQCLESLYKKVTGQKMKYFSLVGKPSEITFRYAEHVLSSELKKLSPASILATMYLIGDTPDVDIVGSNLYQRYIDRQRRKKTSDDENNNEELGGKEQIDHELPTSRHIPQSAKFHEQTVETIESILVCTGVYKKGNPPEGNDEKNYHGHRDFPKNTDLYKPTIICDDVKAAITHILQKEGVHF